MKKEMYAGGHEVGGGLKGQCAQPALLLDACLGVANHSFLVKFTRGFHPCDFTAEVNERTALKQQRTGWRCPLDLSSVRAIFPSRAWPINNIGSTFLYRLLLRARLET